MCRKLMCILLCLALGTVMAQSIDKGTISGFVTDKSTGEGMIGANVFLEGTYLGSSTNTSGFFSMPAVPVGEYELICMFMGYETYKQSVKVKPGTDLKLNIELPPATLTTQEVVVIADSIRTVEKMYRKPISKISLAPRQIESIPQVVETDLLRSLHTMPGIAAVSDFSSELYVRGGTPDQNLYLIDGTDVYNPEHFFGLFSTFNTDAIKNVEISKGGFGSEYGGRLSSVLDVTNLDGNRKEYTGKASVSLLSAKATLQRPLGKFGAISGSIRRTYFDKTLGAVMDDIPDYHFLDGHLKAFLDLGESDKLTLSMYKGQDVLNYKLNEDLPDSETMKYDWGNTTLSARWTHLFSSKLFSNFWITSSSFDSYFNIEQIDEVNDIDDRTVKGNLEYYANEVLNLKWGFEYKQLKSVYKSNFPGGEVDIVHKPNHFASYIQSEYRPTSLLLLQAGLRYNSCFHNDESWQVIEPRLSLKYRLSDKMNLKAAFGNYHQYLFKIPRAFIADIWSSADEYSDDARSNHYIVGFQRELSRDFELEIEAYYKDYSNLYFFDPFFYSDLKIKQYNEDNEPLYNDTENLFDTGDGYSYGMELLIRKDSGPLTGWLSYTLGRTFDMIDVRNQGNWFNPRHDRTHTFNFVGTMDVKNFLRGLKGAGFKQDKHRFRLGFGFAYASGQPITTTSSIYVTRPVPDQDFYHGYNLYPTDRNNFRLPPYIRADLSLIYTRKFKNWTFEPFLQIYNITNRSNVWFINYTDEYDPEKNIISQDVETVGMLPLIPSIGFNILF